MKDPDHPYVGRGGLKLEHALRKFGFDVTRRRCADFGCNVGGFTDCLLQHGAAHVVAVDTAYGCLEYKLRRDDRVTVMERTNALHADLPEGQGPVDLVVADMGWTPQRLVVPAALRWLAPEERSRIITLIKPHYELSDRRPGTTTRRGREGVFLSDDEAQRTVDEVVESMPAFGAEVLAVSKSPLLGGASRGKRGNVEYLALLKRIQTEESSES